MVAAVTIKAMEAMVSGFSAAGACQAVRPRLVCGARWLSPEGIRPADKLQLRRRAAAGGALEELAVHAVRQHDAHRLDRQLVADCAIIFIFSGKPE